MVPSVGKKMSFFIAVVVLLSTGALVVLSNSFIEQRFARILRKSTLDTATLLASRVRNDLRHFAEKGRVLAGAALEQFKSPDDQIRFLEENLSVDEQFVALSLYRRSKTVETGWQPVFRLTRPEGDHAHMTEKDFSELDLKFPHDFSLVKDGSVHVTVGALKDGTPILRMAVPIVRRGKEGFTQLLGIEVRQERLTAAFAEATAHFSFLLDRHGRVLTQTDPTHFTLGEDLSHLPILQMAGATDAPNGNLDYYELPGAPGQHGSFHKVGYADLTVVTQAPRSHVLAVLRDYTRDTGLLALACILIGSSLALLAAWGLVGSRLSGIRAALSEMRAGRFAVRIPEAHSGDEIGDFAAHLQSVCDGMDAREKAHGTYAKFKPDEVEDWIAGKKVDFEGERRDALVVWTQIHGLEQAAGVVTDPPAFMRNLNQFMQQACDAVTESGGVVDRIAGASIVAFWGVPFEGAGDFERAMQACMKIRAAGDALKKRLEKARMPAVKTAIGAHYGKALCGNLGPRDRTEYTLVGEAVVMASRVQRLCDQYATGMIVTGPVTERIPKRFATESVTTAPEGIPFELFEVVGEMGAGAAAPAPEAEAAPAAPEAPQAAPEAEAAPAAMGEVEQEEASEAVVDSEAVGENGDREEPAAEAEAAEAPPDEAPPSDQAADAMAVALVEGQTEEAPRPEAAPSLAEETAALESELTAEAEAEPPAQPVPDEAAGAEPTEPEAQAAAMSDEEFNAKMEAELEAELQKELDAASNSGKAA